METKFSRNINVFCYQGKIAEGMAAELAVFDTDLLTCDIKQLPKLKPALTMVDGRIVHDSGLLKHIFTNVGLPQDRRTLS